MNNQNPTKTVGVCESQAIAAEGLRSLMACTSNLHFVRSVDNLLSAVRMASEAEPDLLVIDKSFGLHAVLEFARRLSGGKTPTNLAVWGNVITESEALQLLQAGVKGIVRKTADLPTLLSCLTTAAGGSIWLEEQLFRDLERKSPGPKVQLTPREQQVLELIERGLKNREIAEQLRISPGTVKIHLRHIFEKTGVRGRYGLALNGVHQRGIMTEAD